MHLFSKNIYVIMNSPSASWLPETSGLDHECPLAGLGGSVGCAVYGNQEVAGSTPAEVGNILSWRLIMKYFLRSFLPSADSRGAVVSFWQKNVHNTG